MGEHQDQIGDELATLGVMAKKQQASAQDAVDRMVATSTALAKQLTALQAAIPAVRQAAKEGAITASAQAFSGIEDHAAKALSAASEPVIARLEATIREAGELEGRLRAAVAWFSWRLAGRMALVFGAGILVLWLTGYAGLWWEREQRREVLAEVSILRQYAAQIRTVECSTVGGPKDRACLPINIKQLYGDKRGDVRYVPVW